MDEGFLSATIKGITVIDDREGTKQEFRLAVGKPKNLGYSSFTYVRDEKNKLIANDNNGKNDDISPAPSMIILDARFSQSLTSVSLCIQRPQLLVALDFLLAVVEFFVPTVGDVLSSEGNKSFLGVDAIILDQSTYWQSSSEMSLSPLRPLIADDERFDHFVYDGRGGVLYLKDRQGLNLCAPSTDAIIYIGTGKRLQFRNITIKVSNTI